VLGAVRACFRKERERLGFRLVHYSIQHDHWHLIVEVHDRVALSRGMQRLNIRCARALNRLAQRAGRVFRDRYHANPMQTPKMTRHCLAYVLLNRRRHLAKWQAPLPACPLPDDCSSGRAFDGWAQGPPLETADEIAPARTWLLRTGWRRHGPIALQEIPGRPSNE
jgi:REP element-mobilizing transposase RayT